MGAEDRLRCAHAIALGLAGTAIRHGGRCTWVAPAVARQPAGWHVVHKAIGGDLYDGTAGIGLFLAEVSARTDDRHLRGLAGEAARHALDRLATGGSGLYTGRIGIAYAVARIAGVSGDPELAAGADAAWTAGQPGPDRGFDLMSGSAGIVLGLLAAGRTALAAAEGDRLLERARRTRRGVCWAPDGARRGRPLLGLSHGAAGAALALARLYEHTGERRFADAARAATRYENGFFDPGHGNWPDLRAATGRGRSLAAGYPAMWCHGAPGIALARRAAGALGGRDAAEWDLESALRTTRRAIETALEVERSDFCMCHGLAGNADVLLSCDRRRFAALCERVADHGWERHAESGQWPCGVAAAGVSPTLMLGVAGIGMFYLRLADATLPSVLDVAPA